MYSQQRKGIVKNYPTGADFEDEEVDILKISSLDLEEPRFLLQNDITDSRWKIAIVEPFFQAELGVKSGDTIVLRQDMMGKAIACQVSDGSPIKDIGHKLVRLSTIAQDRINVDIGSEILIERWETIYAIAIEIEFFLTDWTFTQQESNTTLLQEIETILSSIIHQELLNYPVMQNDVFETFLSIPSREEPLNIKYWIRKLQPNFPILQITSNTKLLVHPRAIRLTKKIS